MGQNVAERGEPTKAERSLQHGQEVCVLDELDVYAHADRQSASAGALKRSVIRVRIVILARRHMGRVRCTRRDRDEELPHALEHGQDPLLALGGCGL